VTREKASEKPAPTPAATPAPAETASVAPTEDRPGPDAAELARAALARLRTSDQGKPAPTPAEPPVATAVREQPREPARDTARPNDTPRVVTAAPVVDEPRTTVPPLPPPVSVVPPSEDRAYAAGGAAVPRSQQRGSDVDRLVPPADIPGQSADADGAPPPKKKSVADDMLSAARSVFQSVVPQ
jgi:hypothetical protein